MSAYLPPGPDANDDIHIPKSILSPTIIGTFYIILVCGMLGTCCHYSRREERRARKLRRQQQLDEEMAQNTMAITGGKAELLAEDVKTPEVMSSKLFELEQPPIPELDGCVVHELHEPWKIELLGRETGRMELEASESDSPTPTSRSTFDESGEDRV